MKINIFARGTSPSTTFKILTLGFLGVVSMLFATAIFIFDPLKMFATSQIAFREGSILYKVWQKPPLEVFITVYVFNVTNYQKFLNGIDNKLKLVEVGPYVYQEQLENFNATFHDNNTVTFTPKRTVKFIRERSIGDPKIDKIIAPNIPYMGASSMASSFSMLTAMALRALTSKLESKTMLEISVHDYLWGYEDRLVYLASKLIPQIINFEKFGLLERMFNEGHNVVNMHLPGAKKPKDQQPKYYRDFSINTWNNEKSIHYWTSGRKQNLTNCNRVYGTFDGSLFPRDIERGEILRIYRKTFCRTLPIVFTHPSTINGIEASNFKLHEKSFSSDLDDADSSCFCKNRKCLKKGLGNITPCYYNIPLAISFPHFLNGDPSLLEPFEGLQPNESKHGSTIVLQPQLGIPMRVKSRFQVNLAMSDISFNGELERFRNVVIPVFWLQIAVDDLTTFLKVLLFLLFKVGPIVQSSLVIILIITGLSLIASAIWKLLPNSLTKYATVKTMKFPLDTKVSIRRPDTSVQPLLQDEKTIELQSWNEEDEKGSMFTFTPVEDTGDIF
uniref:Scavenger receptor class B member 1 n=1 Tax=Glossina brevipalpis TaxID=37001 RepID=A0A1A9WGN3_9MUSC